MIVTKKSSTSNFNTQAPQNWVNSADKDLGNITTALQGRLRFGANSSSTASPNMGASAASSTMGENIAGQFVTFTTPATPNTSFIVPHNLGSTPVGHIVASKNMAVDVYGEPSTWTSTNITLKSTVANANVTLFLMK
jgi:hypothetical protein